MNTIFVVVTPIDSGCPCCDGIIELKAFTDKKAALRQLEKDNHSSYIETVELQG